MWGALGNLLPGRQHLRDACVPGSLEEHIGTGVRSHLVGLERSHLPSGHSLAPLLQALRSDVLQDSPHPRWVFRSSQGRSSRNLAPAAGVVHVKHNTPPHTPATPCASGSNPSSPLYLQSKLLGETSCRSRSRVTLCKSVSAPPLQNMQHGHQRGMRWYLLTKDFKGGSGSWWTVTVTIYSQRTDLRRKTRSLKDLQFLALWTGPLSSISLRTQAAEGRVRGVGGGGQGPHKPRPSRPARLSPALLPCPQ